MKDNFRKQVDLVLAAYRESFVALIPYFFLSSLITLFSQLVAFLEISLGALNAQAISEVSTVISGFIYWLILISIAYHFAKRFMVNHTAVIFLSIAIFITIELLIYPGKTTDNFYFPELSFLLVIIPLVCTLLLSKLLKKTTVSKQSAFENTQLSHAFSYIYPFILTYLGVVVLWLLLLELYSFFMFGTIELSIVLPNEILFVVRNAVSHGLWFVGVHGSNTFDLMVGNDLLSEFIFPGLSYKQFYDLFVIYGGSGAGLSLLIAVLLGSRDKQSWQVGRLSVPFVVFNINELLIFGLPIIFNRFLIIPFIFVPFLNIMIAYGVLHLYPIEIINTDIPWMTPAFVNTYLATGGAPPALLLQLILIVIGSMIYFPFVRRYSALQSVGNHLQRLEEALDITMPLQAWEGLLPYKAQTAIIQSNKEIERVIDTLSAGTLLVYYQPKISIAENYCHNFEALLRFRQQDGTVVAPFFLENVEQAGLASVIDFWVCQAVRTTIDRWRKLGFEATISVNVHPDTLNDRGTIHQMIHLLSGERIEFEIVERGLLVSEVAKQSVYLLKDSGFEISIDDFGTGYSSFETLCAFPIDAVKIDKSLIDMITQSNGYAVIKHISALCSELGCRCVVEGVETREQLLLVDELCIDMVQGYYFSQPLETDKACEYLPNKYYK